MKKKRTNWWWPTIVDQESAKEAIKSGYFAAVFVAAATAVVATISIMLGNDMIPIDGWAYIDAVLRGGLRTTQEFFLLSESCCLL